MRLLGVVGEDHSLDGSTVSNGLVGVGAISGLFLVEEVGDKRDDARNARTKTILCTS